MINIYQPSLGKEELKAVESVFKSNWLGKGPKTKEFIEQFAKKLIVNRGCYGSAGTTFETASVDNLLTISSCTEGLFQSVDLYVNEGDEVILPSISFIGAANAIVAKKAFPVFCDVNPRTLNPSVEDIEKCITKKTTAIIVIHYAGVPCDIERLTELCSQRNIKLIEDNANSPFSRVNMKSTGTFGDVGIWSFDSMKQLVCGDGGMLYCKDEKDARRFDKLTYLGLESKSGFSNSIDKKWWEFDISSPSRRSITNDIQAAIGIEQLKKMDNQLSIRSKIHNTYSKELNELEWLDIPEETPSYVDSSYYMYHVQTKHRDELARYLRDNGVYTTFRYYPLHRVDYYKVGIKLPNTDYAANNTLCIPLHQSLTDNDVEKVTTLIKSFKT